MARARTSVAAGIGCLVLFLLPFAAAGAVLVAVTLLRLRDGNTREAFLAGCAAIAFGGVGFGGIAAVLAGRRTALEQAALEEMHPDAPWLWRPDWASGVLIHPVLPTLHATWAFAALWNVIAAPVSVFAVQFALREEKPGAWLALIFPLIGVGLLVHAIRESLRFRRFGVSRLDLSTVPAPVGRSLAGVLHVPVAVRPVEGFTAVLTSVRCVSSGSAEHHSNREHILWQEERIVPGERDATVTRVPIAFDIPADAEPCDRRDWTNRVEWRLRVSARVPGVDYGACYDVPVFRTPESDLPRPPDEEQRVAARLAAYRAPDDSRIVVSRTQRSTEIWLPAARNPGAAAVTTLLLALFAALVPFEVSVGAPWIFPVLTALISAVVLVFALELWLRVTRVTVRPGSLTWASGYLAPGRERTLSADQIAKIATTVGLTVGTTAYHDVTVVPAKGSKIRLAQSLRARSQAEWLAEAIRSQLAAAE